MLAIKVLHPQVDQLGETNPAIIEEPEDRPIARRRSLRKWPHFVGWRTRQQQLFKLLISNRFNERLAHFWKGHPIKRIVGNEALSHQPMKKRPSGTRIGLHCPFTAHFSSSPWRFA